MVYSEEAIVDILLDVFVHSVNDMILSFIPSTLRPEWIKQPSP